MPLPGLPPTPASSTDLLARESSKNAIEQGFSLGPPAIHSAEGSESSNASVKSDSSYKPSSPSGSRKRPRTAENQEISQEITAADYELPPPPTRSRRIIQMKPEGPTKNKTIATNTTSKKGHARTPSATTAAGKKTARKTAHSIIERRRRSKMNEEFETLKSMIPACNGQQMHKLAILQAGIDYMRYLERCVTDLQGGSRSTLPPPSIPQSQAATPRAQSVEASDSEDEDIEMEESKTTRTEELAVPPRGYTSATASPAILPHQGSSYPFIGSTYSSTAPSPAFGPRHDSWSSLDRPRLSYNLSTTTSPAILPQVAAQDEEASAALLMLNHDRRYSRSDRPTGLSVKDLLSN